MTCYQSNHHEVRVLRGEHTDLCPDPTQNLNWRPPLNLRDCDGCRPCPDRHCVICDDTHLSHDHKQTCPRCVGRVRTSLVRLGDLAVLAEVRLANWWPAASPGLAPGHSTESPLVGGDILAITGPGSAAYANPFRDLDERDDDPAAIAAELATYVDDWTAEQHPDWQDSERTKAPTLTPVLRYLNTHLTWAAQHYTLFDEFAGVIHTLTDRLQAELRNHEHVIRGVPCLSCGTTLERRARVPQRCQHRKLPQRRHWTAAADEFGYPSALGYGRTLTEYEPFEEYDHRVTAWFIDHLTCDQGGIPEDWRCPSCRRTYDPQQYRNAVAMGNRAFAPSATAIELHERFGVEPATIRKLAQRGRITKRGTDHLGRMLYDVDDVRTYTTPAEEPA